MRKILFLIAISLLVYSCGDEDKEKDLNYDTHNIILPENIDLDSFIVSVQLEADFVDKEFEEVQRNPIVFPQPVVNKYIIQLEIRDSINNSKVRINGINNIDSKYIFEGKLPLGIFSFTVTMKELFQDAYGFYKVQVLNHDNVVYEREIFYSNEYFAFQKNENSPIYINLNLLNLENISKKEVKFSSDFEEYFYKEIDRFASDGRYLGTHKLTNNVRIALIKPFEYNYGDAIESGYSEVYEIVLPYSELKQLKEIIFKESDRIKDEEN